MNSINELTTTTKIAQLRGIDRKTISEWRKSKRYGDLPKKIDGKEPLSEWIDWYCCNPEAGRNTKGYSKEREQLICDKLKEEIKAKKIANDTASNKLVEAGKVQRDFTKVVSIARNQLLKLSNDLPPRLAGLGEAKMQAIIRSEIIEILTELSDEGGKLYAD